MKENYEIYLCEYGKKINNNILHTDNFKLTLYSNNNKKGIVYTLVITDGVLANLNEYGIIFYDNSHPTIEFIETEEQRNNSKRILASTVQFENKKHLPLIFNALYLKNPKQFKKHLNLLFEYDYTS